VLDEIASLLSTFPRRLGKNLDQDFLRRKATEASTWVLRSRILARRHFTSEKYFIIGSLGRGLGIVRKGKRKEEDEDKGRGRWKNVRLTLWRIAGSSGRVWEAGGATGSIARSRISLTLDQCINSG
jgi:hypothetical protein